MHVRKLLDHFHIPDHAYFLSQLLKCDGLIAGLEPLNVIHRLSQPLTSTLHVWFEGPDIPRTEEYFEDYQHSRTYTTPFEQGYCLGFESRPAAAAGIVEVIRYTHITNSREILFVKCSGPPVGVITTAPSTLYMNFISADGLHSLYPRLSSLRVGYITVPPRRTTQRIALLDSLGATGFEHTIDVEEVAGEHICGSDPSCPDSARQFPSPSVATIFFPHDFNERELSNAFPPKGYILDSVVWRLRAGRTCRLGSKTGHNGFYARLHGGKECPVEICASSLQISTSPNCIADW